MNKKNLTLDELKYVQDEVKYKSKSVAGSYVLTLLFWPIGINRAYLEKKKSGVVRLALTTSTLLTSFIMANSAASLVIDGISEALVSSTLLAMLFIGLASASLVMLIAELFFIPRWIREIDNENRKLAVEKVFSARYVSEHLLKEQISKELIEVIKEDVSNVVNERTEFLIEELRNKLINERRKALPKIEKIFDIIEPNEDSPIEEVDKYLNHLPIKESLDKKEILDENLSIKKEKKTIKKKPKVEKPKEAKPKETKKINDKGKTKQTGKEKDVGQESNPDDLKKYINNGEMRVTIGELMQDSNVDLASYVDKKEK